MQDDIYNFWKENSPNNIQPAGTPTLHEGWDIIKFLKELRNNYGYTLDIGCGYGRLCEVFDKRNYLGLDYSQESINNAKYRYPDYNFEVINQNYNYPYSDTKLLFYVLLHQNDESIENIIHNLCKSTDVIIVAEICGREWRRKGNPPVFNRNVEEYIAIFNDNNFNSVELINKPYVPYTTREQYKDYNTDLSIMIFEK